jgi:hypothetical protein
MKKTGNRIGIISLLLFISLSALPQSKHPEVGTLNISTEMKGTLYIDDTQVKKMTIYHKVVITGLKPGKHLLVFKYDSLDVKKTIFVTAGQADDFAIKKDSAVLVDSGEAKVQYAKQMKSHSMYIPRGKGFCGLVKIGFSSTTPTGTSPFYGIAIAGYQFSPRISLGGGTGFVETYGSINKSRVQYFIVPETEIVTITSAPFSIPFLPVFIDFRFTLLKKRVSPYLSGSIGCSFPLIQQFDGTWSGDGYYNAPFHVSSISPGWYFAVNPGLKSFIFGKYYLDFFFGWDICVNKLHGTLPDGNSSWTKGTSSFHLDFGFGF